MNFATLLFGSVVSLIEIFYQEDLARDIQETFSSLNNQAIDGAVAQNLYFPTSLNNTYDFIIVGSGSAGSIVAKRLAEAEGGKYNVALLNLGGDAPPQTFVPVFLRQYLSNPNVGHKYQTLAQDLNGGLPSFNTFIGSILGGTSTMNGMVFNRGNPLDYERWVNITGDESWSYQNVLKYFKKLESYRGEFPSDDQHGFDGPIAVSGVENVSGLSTWYKAGAELGYSTAGPNSPQKVSFTPFEFNKRNGRRDTSYQAYIGHKDALQNLKVITFANVTEVLFDEEKRAVGVVYIKHGVSFIAKAEKEVLLSAGAIGTPQILIKSGVGPAKHLEELNIPVIADLPVGENLKDHIIFPLSFVLNDPEHVHGPQKISLEDAVDEFLKNGTGPMTTSDGQIGQAFIASSYAISQGFSNWPDIQYLVSRGRYPIDITSPPVNESEVVIKATVSVGRTQSVGKVTLNPLNVNGPPIIDHQFYFDPQGIDRNVSMEGIKTLLKIFEETQTYQEFGATFQKPNLPVCNDQFEYRSDDWWWCYIRQNAHTGHHHASTCKITIKLLPFCGQPTESSGCERFTSCGCICILPDVINANIQAAIFLMAEKGAEQILSEY